ncbi:MAG: hypothetical protein IPL06_07055 [Betaproteobacteria bacterium]|nr:hypothetical protein [Betaproteobacteria bacterium]
MNADVTPMNADDFRGYPSNGNHLEMGSAATRVHPQSAFIGVTSAFIGVPALLLLAATKEIKWT